MDRANPLTDKCQTERQTAGWTLKQTYKETDEKPNRQGTGKANPSSRVGANNRYVPDRQTKK